MVPFRGQPLVSAPDKCNSHGTTGRAKTGGGLSLRRRYAPKFLRAIVACCDDVEWLTLIQPFQGLLLSGTLSQGSSFLATLG
jgi:hypothetical protein